jgi:hypothetical protein
MSRACSSPLSSADLEGCLKSWIFAHLENERFLKPRFSLTGVAGSSSWKKSRSQDVLSPSSPEQSIISAASTIDCIPLAWLREPCKERCPEHKSVSKESSSESFMALVEPLKRDTEDQLDALGIAMDKLCATVAYFDRLPSSLKARFQFQAKPQGKAVAMSQLLSDFEGFPATFKVEHYVKHILENGGCSPCNVIIGLVYLRRIQRNKCAMIHLSSTNMQRLLLTAVMVASKMYDDVCCSNKYWGMIGEIHVCEMKALEMT